jgi:hypothetical protein
VSRSKTVTGPLKLSKIPGFLNRRSDNHLSFSLRPTRHRLDRGLGLNRGLCRFALPTRDRQLKARLTAVWRFGCLCRLRRFVCGLRLRKASLERRHEVDDVPAFNRPFSLRDQSATRQLRVYQCPEPGLVAVFEIGGL